MTTPAELDQVRERVRARYAQAASTVTAGGVPTCGDICVGPDEAGTEAGLYSASEQDEVPADAVTASLGCGNPLAVADICTGETVLDLGSGGVLRPGGRLGVSDILAEDHLTPAERAERGGPIGCIAGALSFDEYHRGLTKAGFTSISISPTHQVAPGLHSAIIRAVRA